MTETILQEAERIINGDRRKDYGPVEESFRNIAARWTLELGDKLKEPLTAYDVVHLMVQMKLSRAKNGFHRDSYVDIAGYVGHTDKLEEAKPAPVTEWKSLDEVPKDTVVVDKEGHSWRWRTGHTTAEYLSPLTSPWGVGSVWVRVGNTKSSSHYYGPFKLKESNSDR